MTTNSTWTIEKESFYLLFHEWMHHRDVYQIFKIKGTYIEVVFEGEQFVAPVLFGCTEANLTILRKKKQEKKSPFIAGY